MMSAFFWWHWLTAADTHVAYLLLALTALITATCIAWLAWGAKHAPMEEELWPATARTRGMGDLTGGCYICRPDDPYAAEEGCTDCDREFASPTPPKPAEPTGLGAVVEDAEGEKWVRVSGPGLSFAWRPEGIKSDYGDARYWNRVNAVRVLSEGIQ